MGTAIKFTVIIPTRERSDVLLHCLRTVVTQDYADLTIIVSDNFSQDNTKQVVESFQDPRIKYINTQKRVSMSHNYEFALSHVTDGWVAVIGDDDALLPGALTKISEIIKKTGCQAIISDVCRYNWPGTQDKENCLVVPVNQGFELRKSREWLAKVLKGETGYMELPFLYAGGVIDSQIINKARSAEGTFYFSFNPDVYSAVALSCVVDDYVMLKEPVVIAGLSSHSIGASAIGSKKFKEPAQKFLSEGNISFHSRLIHKNWPEDLPKSMPIYVYECYLQTENIHHDFLEIEMEDQLALALSKCPQGDYDALRKYCVEISLLNGIDIKKVESQAKALGRWKYFKDLRENIYRSFNYRVLCGKEFGIHNVYEAAILAKAVFLCDTRYASWRLKKLLQGFKKVFKL